MMRPGIILLTLALGAGITNADPGDVLWHFEVNTPGSPLHRPSIGADGTIYWSTNSLYAITPSGQEIWSRDRADPNPVGIGHDGTLYIGGWRPPPNSHLPALRAFTPSGDHLWDFFDFGDPLGVIGGPNVGPDGNIYAVMFGGFNPNPPGFGALSLTPAGALRWHVDGFAHLMAGTVPSEIVFGDGNMYKAESNAPMPAGQQQSGLVAIEFDGDIAWQHPAGIPSNSPYRQPAVNPLNGNVHLCVPTRTLRTFNSSGSLLWYYNGAFTPTGFGTPAAGPDGSVYVINGGLHVIALDAAGNERWVAQNVSLNTAYPPEVSPDGSLLVFGTAACNGGACPARIIGINTADGSVAFNKPLPNVPGGIPTIRTQPRFSNDGSVVYIAADAFTTFTKSYLFAIETTEQPPPLCYANCDQSTAAPILNVDDFTCFINQYATGSGLPHAQQVMHYANCDGSTVAPALNVDDFTCFINEFAAGCP
jgi:hypothetical protein